jgi:hypothetical protein
LLGDPAEVHRYVLNRLDIYNLIRFFASVRIFRNLQVSESLMTEELAGLDVVVGSDKLWRGGHGLAFEARSITPRPGQESNIKGSKWFFETFGWNIRSEPARHGFRFEVYSSEHRLEPEIILAFARFLVTVRWVQGLRVGQNMFTPELAELGVRGDLAASGSVTRLVVYFSEEPLLYRAHRPWIAGDRQSPLVSAVLVGSGTYPADFWRVFVHFPNDELLKIKPFSELDY